jgi:hypothetical protein
VITKLNKNVLESISSKYNIEYVSLNNTNDFDKINNIITSNIDLINIKKDINNRVNLTRLFIFISFLFFSLSLVFENIL